MKHEFKTFSFELKGVKDDGTTGVIEGYASTFGNVDLGLDIVDKGAFKKTIKENPNVPILADHNPTTQIGWNIQASEDNTGLAVVGEIDLNVQLGKERYSLAKKAQALGANMGLSIGYFTIQAAPDTKNPMIRHLKELKLFEYSLVTFPMNTEAMITAAKGLGQVDKVKFLLKHIKEQGISIKDLELALQAEAADLDYDPAKICQSYDRLIAKFRGE